MYFRPIKINGTNVRTEGDLIGAEELKDLILPHLKRRLCLHHDLYDCPPKGTILENLIVNVLNKDLGLGQMVDGLLFGWKPESHKVGADLTVPSLICRRPSIKTGNVKKIGRGKRSCSIREDHRLIYSSSRTTTHGSLTEKLEFLKNPHCDVTFFLSPNAKYGRYYWIMMENLNFSDLDWVDRYSKGKNNHVGWTGKGGSEGIISAQISTKLSSQIWVELHLSSRKIIQFEEICI